MRKLPLLLCFALVVFLNAAHAQSGAIRVVCEGCRDPLKHPDDYANFAFNQIYGEHAWMDFDQADDFWIYNLDGDRVYVDVDFVMEGISVLGNDWPVWPTNMLKITLALPNGDMIEVFRSVFMTPLPVPSDPETESDDGGSSGGDQSGEDGVDDTETSQEDPHELPEIDVTGTTGIEDPDADGHFPDPDWCEEC